MESDISFFTACESERSDVPILQSQGLDDLPVQAIDVYWGSAYLRFAGVGPTPSNTSSISMHLLGLGISFQPLP